MPLHVDPNGQKADQRHTMLEPITAAMEVEARAQAAELPPTGKPVASPSTLIAQKAKADGFVRFG